MTKKNTENGVETKTGSNLEHDSAYLISLTNLPTVPGARQELDIELPLQTEWTNGVVKLVGEKISCQVELTSVSDGVLVSISGRVGTEAECSRCLTPVHSAIDLEETQMFFFPHALDVSEKGTGEHDTDIQQVREDNEIDLEPLLRDNLVLALPNLPLCDPDCLGLCPECGQRWDTLPPDHRHEVVDPRWGALSELASTLREQVEETK